MFLQLQGDLIYLEIFCHFLQGGSFSDFMFAFMYTMFILKGIYSKRRESAPSGAYSFFLECTHFRKDAKTILTRIVFSESISIPLKGNGITFRGCLLKRSLSKRGETISNNFPFGAEPFIRRGAGHKQKVTKVVSLEKQGRKATRCIQSP